MFPTWGYMGVEYEEMSFWGYGMWLCCSVLPIIFYKGCTSISAFLSFFIYIFIYIPCLHSLFVSFKIDDTTVLNYSLALVFAMSLFFAVKNWRLPIGFAEYKKIPFQYIEIVTIVFLILILIPSLGSIRFVNFMTDQKEMYDLRAELSTARRSIPFIGYIGHWVKSGLLPILFTVYLKNKTYKKLALCVFGYFLCYLVDMQKVTLLTPLFLYTIYTIMKGTKAASTFHVLIMAGIMFVCILLYCFIEIPVFYMLASIFIMRTVCVDGWLASLYYKFFITENEPFTYYSHINIINWITQSYPFKDSLGVAIAHGHMNGNASFIITDGVAAGGAWGIVVIAIVFALFLAFMNRVCDKYNLTYIGVGFLSATISLLNVSFFTSILTCGFGVLILILLFVDMSPIESTPTEEEEEEAPTLSDHNHQPITS